MLRLILRFTVIELFCLRPVFEGCEGADKETGTATAPKQRFKSVSDALEIIFTTVVYLEFYFVFKVLALVV